MEKTPIRIVAGILNMVSGILAMYDERWDVTPDGRLRPQNLLVPQGALQGRLYSSSERQSLLVAFAGVA